MSRINVVPDNDPDANGRWIDVPYVAPHWRNWPEHEVALAPYIPEGEHLVAIHMGEGSE